LVKPKINNIALLTLSKGRSLLSKNQRRKLNILVIFTIIGGIIDIFGLAGIIPAVKIISDPTIIDTNSTLSWIYGSFGFGSKTQFQITILGGIVLIFVFKNVLLLAIKYYQTKFSYNVANDLTATQLKYYLNPNDIDANDKELNSSIVAHNVAVVPSLFSLRILLTIINFLSELVIIAFIVVSVAIYNYEVFLLIAATLTPVFIILYKSVKTKIQKIERLTNKISPIMINDTLEAVRGMEDVILYQRIDFFSKKILRNQMRLNKMKILSHTYDQAFPKIIELTAIMGIVALLAASVYFAEKESLLTIISVYMVAAYKIMPSSNKILQAIISMKSFDFVFDILKKNPKDIGESVKEGYEPLDFKSEINLHDIHFKYADGKTNVLNGLTLKVKKGEKIGIVGESGAGKTSLINVLLRFNIENKGQLLVDGVALTEKNIQSWRKLIGYVKQNVFLIDGTVAQNIAFGIFENHIDNDKLTRSIEMAGLKDTISNMENGLNTKIGEQGAKLSGGQRQRIAIARALYKGAEILIFDEATNALDLATEKGINNSIGELNSKGVTVIIVSHRQSALDICDTIYDLKKGQFQGAKNI
jgi:ABC-type multidrug transport system fused ATPase/permease subunit